MGRIDEFNNKHQIHETTLEDFDTFFSQDNSTLDYSDDEFKEVDEVEGEKDLIDDEEYNLKLNEELGTYKFEANFSVRCSKEILVESGIKTVSVENEIAFPGTTSINELWIRKIVLIYLKTLAELREAKNAVE